MAQRRGDVTLYSGAAEPRLVPLVSAIAGRRLAGSMRTATPRTKCSYLVRHWSTLLARYQLAGVPLVSAIARVGLGAFESGLVLLVAPYLVRARRSQGAPQNSGK